MNVGSQSVAPAALPPNKADHVRVTQNRGASEVTTVALVKQ